MRDLAEWTDAGDGAHGLGRHAEPLGPRHGLFKARRCRARTNATQPFWSPDSRSLAFFAIGKLKKIAIAGAIRRFSATCGAARRHLESDGVILFAPSSNGPLFTIPAAGATRMP